jgi:integrase
VTPARRRFGSVRKRASGRYQVRYLGPDGRQRTTPETFARKSDADRYLSVVEAQMVRGEWIDPARAEVRLQDYAERWIAQRPGLRPRTAHLYSWLLGKHITPYLGPVPLGKLDTPTIREWRARLLATGVSQTMAAKAYRLLRAVLTTAVREDELLRTNPCRIPGADQEKPGERPVLTVAQVLALADVVPPRYRALVLVSTFGCLRWGEVTALQRQDLDVDAGMVRVRQHSWSIGGVGSSLARRSRVPAGGRLRFRRLLFRQFGRISRSTCRRTRERWCSPVRVGGRSGAGTSTSSSGGRRPWTRSACLACTSTICVIPGTRWRPGRARACAI